RHADLDRLQDGAEGDGRHDVHADALAVSDADGEAHGHAGAHRDANRRRDPDADAQADCDADAETHRDADADSDARAARMLDRVELRASPSGTRVSVGRLRVRRRIEPEHGSGQRVLHDLAPGDVAELLRDRLALLSATARAGGRKLPPAPPTQAVTMRL